jgi:hypothetical protein
MKYFLLIIFAIILTLVSISYYSKTDNGKYGILKKNALMQVEHITKSRDLGVKLNEALSWFDDEWKKDSPVITDCIIEGINYLYSRPELNPKEIRNSYERIIDSKKDYWMSRIKNEKK